MVKLMSEELQQITDSLRMDAGLPKVPDVSPQVRTLQDVKTELDVAIAKADELTSVAVYLSGALETLTGSLAKLELSEQRLIDLVLRKSEV